MHHVSMPLRDTCLTVVCPLRRAVTKLVEFSHKWHQAASEKNASAPLTMAKFFPQSAGALWPSDGGAPLPPDQTRRQLRLRLQSLLAALREGDVGDAALPAWTRAVSAMEESAAQR